MDTVPPESNQPSPCTQFGKVLRDFWPAMKGSRAESECHCFCHPISPVFTSFPHFLPAGPYKLAVRVPCT